MTISEVVRSIGSSEIAKSLASRIESRPVVERVKIGALSGFALSFGILAVGNTFYPEHVHIINEVIGYEIRNPLVKIIATSSSYAALSALAFGLNGVAHTVYRDYLRKQTLK